MAVTAIWDIKGRVDQLLGYVMNPQKTMSEMAALHAVEDVLKYAASSAKTEQMKYVSGINCNPARAVTDFRQTKKRWKKTGGIVAFHAYQSFKPGEVDPESAHKIGVALARELWGDRFEVVVATTELSSKALSGFSQRAGTESLQTPRYNSHNSEGNRLMGNPLSLLLLSPKNLSESDICFSGVGFS